MPPDYGSRHRRLRRHYAYLIGTGRIVRCASGRDCKHAEGEIGGRIVAGSSWDLGHDPDNDRRYIGPQHSECNRATFGRGESRRRPDEGHPGMAAD